MAGVEIKKVDEDENGMRVDRWFKAHYPGLGFGYLQNFCVRGKFVLKGAG